MKQYMRSIIEDKQSVSLMKPLKLNSIQNLDDTNGISTPKSCKTGITTSFTNYQKNSQTQEQQLTSNLIHSTSKIVLTQRDLCEEDNNSEQQTPKVEELREHFKQCFQPISTQSITSLEINLRNSTPKQKNQSCNATSRASTLDGSSRNNIYISDPTPKKQLATPVGSSKPNCIDINDNFYQITLVDHQPVTQKTSLGNKELTRKYSSVSDSSEPIVNNFTQPTKEESVSSSSNNIQNYLIGRLSRQNTAQKSGISEVLSIQSVLNTPSKNIIEEPAKYKPYQRYEPVQKITDPTKQQLTTNKNNIIESSLADVVLALGKLQICLQPVINEKAGQPETDVEFLKNKLAEQQSALLKSESEKRDLSTQLNQLTAKLSLLLGAKALSTPLPSSTLLLQNLEDALKEKDLKIAILQSQLKENMDEKDKEIVALKKQFHTAQKVEAYGQPYVAASSTGVNKFSTQSYSLNNSPAIRNNKYSSQRTTPLGLQTTNMPYHHGPIGIKENEFPVMNTMTTSGGYNVFKAKIDQLNSLRDDRVSTALRK